MSPKKRLKRLRKGQRLVPLPPITSINMVLIRPPRSMADIPLLGVPPKLVRDLHRSRPDAKGIPEYYAVVWVDRPGDPEGRAYKALEFWPTPDASYGLRVRYIPAEQEL